MSIGERIRDIRIQRGLTQVQLAEASGVAPITIRQYEANKRQPRMEQLRAIAEVFGVSVDYLISEPQAKGARALPFERAKEVTDHYTQVFSPSLTLDRILLLIQNSGKTDKQIESELGLPPASIKAWRSGETKSYTKYIYQFAKYFEVTTEYLLGISDDDRTLEQVVEDLAAGKPPKGISILPYGGDKPDLSELVALGPDNTTHVFVRAKDDSITEYTFSPEKWAAVQQILDAMADKKEVRF